jgi:hypothetical protein
MANARCQGRWVNKDGLPVGLRVAATDAENGIGTRVNQNSEVCWENFRPMPSPRKITSIRQ